MGTKIKFNQFTIELELGDGLSLYKFFGDVDESFKYEKVPPPIKNSHIVFEMGELGGLNSCAIREWIHMISSFSKIGSVTYRHCPVLFVDQINMVPELKLNSVVESFYAPYYCEKHGEEINKLIGSSEILQIQEDHGAPSFDCEKCGGHLEFDAIEESYFSFIEPSVKKAS